MIDDRTRISAATANQTNRLSGASRRNNFQMPRWVLRIISSHTIYTRMHTHAHTHTCSAEKAGEQTVNRAEEKLVKGAAKSKFSSVAEQ